MNDYAEISQLVARERLYRVRHVKELADCYYPDATVATSWQAGSLDSFLHGEPAEVDPKFSIFGSISTPVVHQNSNRAYVELPTTTHMRMIVKGVLMEIESYRRLIYRVEKRDQDWKIASMISINESDNLRPVVPGTTLKIDPKELEGLRPSYQFLAYVRQAAGGKISSDLLGIDRPDDVAKVYAKAEDWLTTKK